MLFDARRATTSLNKKGAYNRTKKGLASVYFYVKSNFYYG